jgi:hypothetical protein
MGVKPDGTSLDRIDVNGNYCKKNCRWADLKTQAENKRNTISIKAGNEKFSTREMAKLLGIKYATLASRIYRHGHEYAQIVSWASNLVKRKSRSGNCKSKLAR